MTYRKIVKGKYEVIINKLTVVVKKVSKRQWNVLSGDEVICNGNTRAAAIDIYIDQYAKHVSMLTIPTVTPSMMMQQVGRIKRQIDCTDAGRNCANGEFSPCPRCRTENSVDRDNEDELTLDTLLEDDDTEPHIEPCIEPCIKPECIERIKPDAVEFWIDNCMSKSLQQQLSTIIIDQPSLFGEIVEYCLEDATPYYRYLATQCANLSSLDDAIISHIMSRFEIEYIVHHDTQTIQAVCEAFSESINTGDTKGYYAANALYMCVVRSTNASFYAIQAGIKPDDIIEYALNMLLWG